MCIKIVKSLAPADFTCAFFTFAHLQKGSLLLCTISISSCLSLYALVTNEFTHAKLVHAEFLYIHTKKICEPRTGCI